MKHADFLVPDADGIALPRSRGGRGARAFMPAFGGAFAAPFATPGGAVPHWSTLGGTIAPSHIAAWTPKGAASLAASYVQYGTLGSGLTVGIAPSWSSATGWTGNGTSQYLKSGVIPVNNQTWSAAVQISGMILNKTNKFIFGNAPVSGTAFAISDHETIAAAISVYSGSSTGKTGLSSPFSGNLMIAGNKLYINGIDQGIALGTAVETFGEIYILALNFAGTPFLFSGSTESAIVFYNFILSPTQALQLGGTVMPGL